MAPPSTPAATSPVAASPSAGESVAASTSPTSAASLCRMPAILRVDQGGNRLVLGWLNLPEGTTTDDPDNHIVVASNYPVGAGVTVPIWATDHSPQLFGKGFATYSTSLGRWLPAPPQLVSADGQHYAYLHPDGTIRLADASGAEAIVANPNRLTPFAYTPQGVILTVSEPAANGLRLLDPTSKTITLLVDRLGTYDWGEVSNGVAWGVDSPGGLGYPPATNVIESAIPPNSRPVTAYTAPSGDSITSIASDRQGGVLVVVAGSEPALKYIPPSYPNQPPVSVGIPSGLNVAVLGPRHHADAHGIWFVSGAGVYLFTLAAGLKLIAPGVTTDAVPGGDCV